MSHDRRTFLRHSALASLTVLLPLPACGGTTPPAEEPTPDPLAVPRTMPADWDAVAFNTSRGNAGAIPAGYLPAVNAADGASQAVGKHLPYVPAIDGFTVPEGHLAVMWGDPSKGHAKHPNAVRNESNQMQGHWYDWIDARLAVAGESETVRSAYPEWPGDSTTGYAVLGGGDITADAGKNTVYLVRLPAGARSGDRVRIHAHCLTHGEYVDFLVVP